MNITLPQTIDAEHLTHALRGTGMLAHGRVTQVQVDSAFATVLSHIFRLRPIYEDASGDAPRSLILKAGLADRPGGPWQGGRQEVAFYTEVAPAMPAGLVPRCFDAHWDPATGAWHLLLEDLAESHLVATQWPLPPSAAQCESIVRARARFQAAWWDDPRLGTAIGHWQDDSAIDASLKSLQSQFTHFAAALGDRLSAERHRLYERLIDAAPRLLGRYRSHRHMTIVQGDAHVWNCFLPRDGGLTNARLFDWDAWHVDVGADDLACMMAVQWYPELRGRFEQRLLDCHHDALLACGVQGYDRQALQDDYRLSVLWQITAPLWQHANGIPPVIWWNNLERIHLAVDDLGCRDLLAG